MKKILLSGFLLLFLMAAIRHVGAQTTLIDPTGAGGFELGSTFSANGWTVVNGTPVNRWVCSTGATAGFSGANAAYISSNDAGAPPPHTYITQSSTVHLYRDVTFPMGETDITFNFDIRMTGDAGWDRLLVYISNSTPSGTPSAGIPSSNATTLTEYTLLSIQAPALSWTKRTETITAAQAGNAAASSTRRILFVWQNRGGVLPPNPPPVAIDNINLVSALPPANDNCTGTNGTPVALTPQAFASSCSSPVSATTVGATQSNTNCSSSANDDVWFVFTAAATTQTVRFENVVAVLGTVNSMGMDLYTTCGGTSTNCNTAITILSSGAGENKLFNLTVGTQYFLRIWTDGASNSATFNICIINPPPPPANDNCAGAIALTVNPNFNCNSSIERTTVSATQTSGETAPSCGATGINDDVWFTFQATGTDHRILVEARIGISTMLIQVYSGTCGSLSLVTGGCATFTDRLNLTGLTAGTTYTVRVATASSTATTNTAFSIGVCTPPPPPANDLCSGATPLTPASTCTKTAGTTLNARVETGAGICTDGGENAVWFSFVQPAGITTMTVSVDGGIGFDAVLGVFNACGVAGSPTGGSCTNVTSGGDIETCSLTGLTPGNTYYIQVHNWSGDNNSFTIFDICVFNAALPLELLSFTGKTTPTSNMLQWETLTEKNVQWHIIERSVDGIKWMEVGKTAGQMDSQVPVKYELEDHAPLAKAYYRLRSVDYDGAENLSSTIVLTRKGEHFGITAAFPSPTKDQVTVQFASLEEEDVTIQVMDISGRLVLVLEYAADNGINEAVLPLDGLQAGVYLVRISNATATAEPMRIVKE
jgi:Secretion system C-terminal sorting domain